MTKRRRIFIIAEAGVNHNGSLKTAKEMIDAAKMAGADAIKFQTFKAESLASRSAPKADYQKESMCNTESQFDMLKRLELDEAAHKELIRYCRKNGLKFLSSPFDLESIDLLNRLGLEIFKIPSGEITNLPYLRKIGSLKKEVIISTGMSGMEEIKTALDVLVECGTAKENITILHCNTEYPTPYTDVNLRAMVTIRGAFNVDVGYSDHTLGIEISIAAAALGASVIEKHFTLDRKMKGPDHKASLEPAELKAMISAIRNVEEALGSLDKRPSASEKANISIVRKSITASNFIKKGSRFTEVNITAKRPARGLSPMKWDSVVGKTAKKDFQKDELIEL